MKRRINPASMQWVNKPGMTIVNGDKLIIETEPHTSLNGLMFGSRAAAILELEPMKNFTLDLRIDYEFHKNEDECGILLKISDVYWCKFCLDRKDQSLDEAFMLNDNTKAVRKFKQICKDILDYKR